ncbi:beta-galactosidase [Algibacillus agarilyticus]|uniref:beta-galactosidase n=1 Tax=Algibacillus agarilyticus TaxID=2234133 RepID=UPI000DD0AC70|nr:beta-galactosidase [Algibacillus agarilyticus]
MSKKASLLGFGLFVLMGCNDPAQSQKKADSPRLSSIMSFEDAQAGLVLSENNTSLLLENSLGKVISGDASNGILQGDKAYQITLQAKEHYKSAFTLKPKTSWNWSQLGHFSVALNITNPTEQSTHLFTQIEDGKNQLHNRSVIIPKQSSNTYYIELSGDDLEIESGIRSNPPAWQSIDTPFIWRWGVKQLDLTSIKHIKFTVASLLADRTLVIDDIRLVKNPTSEPDYLANLVDRHGQRNGIEYANKIASDDELKQRSRAELATLTGERLPDRSKFGGWKKGPKLAATGFFRTEKIDGQWSLVDPEGYLFYSIGIANVRMANTSTITGIDFSSQHIEQRTSDDVTPEDSKGLNTITGEALKSKFVASDTRFNMFSWLPTYDEPLAKHYGYRREVHSGALKQGETYSFYQANLERKYGADFLTQWRDTTVDRMIDWGFTSFGNWIDPMFYQLNRFPYFANGWIIGDFKKVSSGADYWSPLPDPFDPKFAERAKATMATIAAEVKNNPWCVGVFIDNEKSWGREGSIESQYGIVIHTLARDNTDSPTKAVFSRLMQNKYKDINALNQSWNTQIASWQAFNKGVKLNTYTDAQIADYSALLSAYANEYFNVVNTELKAVMPNHLYMGVRFADWGMTPEVVQAAAEHADVVSYNFYKEGLHPSHWQFLAQIDKPSIIGEFHMGATDTGLLNPGLVHTASQAERAQAYKDYMATVLDNPYFVGAHWFQYTDSPLTGRAYDGENYNVGFVSVTDSPYQEMVEAVKAVGSTLYTRKYKKLTQ